jgi:hypothetical protein
MNNDPLYHIIFLWAGGAVVWSWSSVLGAFANTEMPIAFSIIIAVSAAGTTLGAIMTSIFIIKGRRYEKRR